MNKLVYRIFIAVLWLTGSGKLLAQDVRVNAVLDSSKIRIGEQVKLDLYLNYDASQKNISIQWPQIGDTLTEKVEVISVTPIDTTLPDKAHPSNMLQHQQILVSAYDSGYFAIPGFKFILNNDTAHPLYTQPLFLEVHTVPTDSSATKIKDIKPLFEEPFNWKWYLNYIYFGGGALLLLAIVIIVTVYLTKRNKKTIVEPEKPKIPAHITALAALEKIKAEQVWREEKTKEYYSSISEAVRQYIEERFNVNALESTTDEIMTAFRSQVVDRESKDKLQQLLMLSDLVKFAKQFPIESEHVFTLQNAFDFVNGTRREDEVFVPDASVTDPTTQAPVANQTINNTASVDTTSNASYMPSAYSGAATASTQPVQKPADKTVVSYTIEPQSKKKTMLKRIGLAIAFVLSFVLIWFIYHSFTTPSSNKQLGQTINNINMSCPVMVNNETRLDNVILLTSNVVQYNYTFVHYAAGQIDIDEVKGQIEPAILNEVKTSPGMALFRENNMTMTFKYKDREGKILFTIKVEPKDYSTNS